MSVVMVFKYKIHPPCRATSAAVHHPYQDPVSGEPSASSIQEPASHFGPTIGPTAKTAKPRACIKSILAISFLHSSKNKLTGARDESNKLLAQKKGNMNRGIWVNLQCISNMLLYESISVLLQCSEAIVTYCFASSSGRKMKMELGKYHLNNVI